MVIASRGYPAAAQSGDAITGVGEGVSTPAPGCARTAPSSPPVGGPSCCTGVAPTLDQARVRAYELVHRVRLDGAIFRTDIAAL